MWEEIILHQCGVLAYDTAILTVDEEEKLQYMSILDKLVRVKKNYGIKINIEKTKVMKVLKKRKQSFKIVANEQNLDGME